jgi:hypothetical protein
MCEVLALAFICLSQNETQSAQALLAIEQQRVIMPERGRIRKKPSVRQPPMLSFVSNVSHASSPHYYIVLQPVNSSLDLSTGDPAPATPGSESSPKRAVPPTPGSSASRQTISDDDVLLISPNTLAAINPSNRQQMLDCPLFAHQAKEGESGSSVEVSGNSEDDRHLPDESYVTQGSYSDGDHGIYMASLTSQGRELGFGTPMHLQRRPVSFRSSFDDDVRLLAWPGYEGPVCPQNHRLKGRTYKKPGRHCDACEEGLEGRTGFHCKVCDFDLCTICWEARPAARSPAVKSPPFRSQLVASLTSPLRGAIQNHDRPAARSPAVRSSPFRGQLVASITSPFRSARQNHHPAVHAPSLQIVDEVIAVSSDGSPPAPVKVHPFFLSFPGRRPGVGVNQLQFHAVARQPVANIPVASPSHFVRQPYRMRRRVSTPTFRPTPTLVQLRPRQTRPQVSIVPFSTLSPSDCNVVKVLFPDLLPLTPVHVCAGTQTSPRSSDCSPREGHSLLPGVMAHAGIAAHAGTQTSPRSRDCSHNEEMLTLKQLREELIAFAKAFGF